jgi:SAM-dependent methyltransferase
MNNPPCPVTGEPAVRLIQWIKPRFLLDLWRYGLRVDARSSFGEVTRFGLWESPTGLYFFDPMLEGDHTFYTAFYANAIERKLWARECIREEFRLAARSIAPGAGVLDVGCGFAEFRRVIPHASYTGLDPHFAGESRGADVRNETLRAHLSANGGAYDAVCAFQVIEHLREPTAMVADMVQAAKPGGLLIIGVPHVPSAFTRFPNNPVNAPPHHLTWWTRAALSALAERHGATVISIETVPWGDCDSLLYWMERCSPLRCRDIFYRNRPWWHASVLIGLLGGRMMHALRGTPRTSDEGAGLLMVARRQS